MHSLPFDDIVWIQTAFIGDIIINTGVCSMIRRQCPSLRQHLITTPIGADALKGCEIFDSIIGFDKRRQGFWTASGQVKTQLSAKIGRRSRALILQPHRSFRSSLLARRLGIRTISFSDSQLAFLASHRIKRDRSLHESKRIGSLVAGAGLDPVKFEVKSPWMNPIDRSQLSDAMRGIELPPKLIGIAPGSVWGTKKWINSGFCQLTARLLDQYPDHSIVLIGGPAEKEDCRKIGDSLSAANRSRIFDLCGQTTLSDLRWLIPQLSMLVSNDSSPVHYASAFNIPTVTIFGSTTPALGFGPLADRSHIAEISLGCRPCSAHGPQICPLGHFECMRNLSVDSVFGACIKTLPTTN